ncbi:MAG: hypothetical protein CO141_04200, partial [Candidatus Moranbacteria bacterium CG_4_9_14_3_um_filter_42_9]
MNPQSSAIIWPFRGSEEAKKLRQDVRKKLRLVVLIAKDPHVKDVCMGIVVGYNECICRRLRKWKEPVPRILLRKEARDDSRVCRKCRECTRPDEGL